jgi:hypothetical protein
MDNTLEKQLNAEKSKNKTLEAKVLSLKSRIKRFKILVEDLESTLKNRNKTILYMTEQYYDIENEYSKYKNERKL